jgi:hypothetical protein
MTLGQIGLLIVGTFATSCAQVDGGAVELSWTLRPASSSLTDKFVACNATINNVDFVVAEVRLDWMPVSGEPGSESWPCDNSQGVTKFDLPTGDTLLSVSPVCDSGPAAPDTYIAPAPERRTVIAGDTVSLGAVELVLQVSSCDQQPCICH